MTNSRNKEAKTFLANALLDLNGSDPEWLAVIRDQITMMGRFIEATDKQMYEKILDHLISSPKIKEEMLIKHRNKR